MISKQFRLILLHTADAARIVGLLQHGLIHNVDRQRFRVPDALVGIVSIAHADHHPVMADDAQMSDQRPVGLTVYHCTNYHQRCWIQCQFRTNMFLHI